MKSLKKLWRFLRKPSSKWALGTLLLTGFVVGGIFIFGTVKTLEWTNSDGFCTGCHTMQFNKEEFTGSVHDVNRTGVRPKCSQCHVPEEGIALLIRKMQAANDVYQHFIGKSIDTREKFEARRGHLAFREWSRMKKSDSKGCRSCHNESQMDLALQSPRARTGHTLANDTNQTCIDCHKGIAHELPENWLELEQELNQKFPNPKQR